MDYIQQFIEQNRDRFLEELFELIRIPSISARSEYRDEIFRAVNCLKKNLMDAGADRAVVMETAGNPVLYAEKIIGESNPTILVYGHYDVQPAEPLDQWTSPPFEPEIRDGLIFGRGADDNKGQLYMHVKAFELLVKTGNLKCNVKFMIEGEEETGSPNLKNFCIKNKKLLKSDIILISDTTMISGDIPSITVGLRGLTYLELEVTGPNRDLHSGLYGGAVANPANELARIIASLKDENNYIAIPGFYDDVLPVSEPERTELLKAPFDLEKYKSSLDIPDIAGEVGYTTTERTGIRPCLDVCGLWSGYQGEGTKTIIPAAAYAKISMRLVPEQKSEKINRLFAAYVKKIASPAVRISIKNLHGGKGYIASIDNHAYQAASRAMEQSFGKKPVPTRSGGSIPIVADFEEVLGVKSILMGFGLNSDAIHSPNENFPLYNFYKGIETIPLFYKYFAEK